MKEKLITENTDERRPLFRILHFCAFGGAVEIFPTASLNISREPRRERNPFKEMSRAVVAKNGMLVTDGNYLGNDAHIRDTRLPRETMCVIAGCIVCRAHGRDHQLAHNHAENLAKLGGQFNQKRM